MHVAKQRWPEEDPGFIDRLLAAAAVPGTSAAALRVVAVSFEELAGAEDAAVPSAGTLTTSFHRRRLVCKPATDSAHSLPFHLSLPPLSHAVQRCRKRS